MIILLDAPLGAAFIPTTAFLMQGERETIDFDITVTAGPAKVEWFLEFAQDPTNGPWRREVAEEDVGGGVTHMPKVVRDFQETGGAGLAVGVHNLSTQHVRAHQFSRVQIRAAAGTVTRAVVTAIFGLPVVTP